MAIGFNLGETETGPTKNTQRPIPNEPYSLAKPFIPRQHHSPLAWNQVFTHVTCRSISHFNKNKWGKWPRFVIGIMKASATQSLLYESSAYNTYGLLLPEMYGVNFKISSLFFKDEEAKHLRCKY